MRSFVTYTWNVTSRRDIVDGEITRDVDAYAAGMGRMTYDYADVRLIVLPDVPTVSLVKVIPNDAACAECGWLKCEHDRAGADLDRVRCPGGDDDSRFVLRVSLDDYAMGLPNAELNAWPFFFGTPAPLVRKVGRSRV